MTEERFRELEAAYSARYPLVQWPRRTRESAWTLLRYNARECHYDGIAFASREELLEWAAIDVIAMLRLGMDGEGLPARMCGRCVDAVFTAGETAA